MKIVDDLKKWYQKQTPDQKKKTTRSIIIVLVIAFALLTYSVTHHGKTAPKTTNSTNSTNLMVNSNSIEKDLFAKNESNIQKMQQTINTQNATLKKLQEKLALQNNVTNSTNATANSKVMQIAPLNSKNLLPPPPPPSSTPPALPKGASQEQTLPPSPPPAPQSEIIGGIDVVSTNATMSTPASKKKILQEQEQKEVYLPTSFMEGILLSGLDAPAMENGAKNPIPALIRIQTPAVLPNSVKANLKGCFVIAEGVGDLATERANMRLVTISCILKNGQAAIDQPIKGFVVDSDGKIGLRGRVVSKMGSAIARSFLAGMLSGFGNAVSSAATTNNLTALGSVSTLGTTPSDLAKESLGGGLATASNQIAQFYLNLAKQSIPVVEIGAGKKLTIVITQGEELHLRYFCISGQKCRQNPNIQSKPIIQQPNQTKNHNVTITKTNNMEGRSATPP